MKKSYFIITFLVLVAMLAIYFFWNNKKVAVGLEPAVYKHVLKSSDIVGTVNYNEIEDIVQSAIFSNPFELIALQNQLGEQDFVGDLLLALLEGGINKNHKMVFAAENTSKSGYLLMELRDTKKFKKNLKVQLSGYKSITLKTAKGAIGSYYLDQKVGIIIQEELALIVCGKEEVVVKLSGEILDRKECYGTGSSAITKLKKSNDHISVWLKKDALISECITSNSEGFVYVNFLNGELRVNGSFSAETNYFTDKNVMVYDCDTCAISLNMNMKNNAKVLDYIGPLLHQKADSVFQLLNIDYKQLVKHNNGKINAVLIGNGVQKESIITYEFDDNFNKVKKEEIRLIPITDFLVEMGTEHQKMYGWLKEKKVIKYQGGLELFTNPVGKCYVNVVENGLLLAPNIELFGKYPKIERDSLGFNLRANFDGLNALFSNDKYDLGAKFSMLNCNATQRDSVISFQVNLQTKNASKNALFDVVNVVLNQE